MAKKKMGEETPATPKPTKKTKTFEVLNPNGSLLRTYDNKENAESLASKVSGRKVVEK